MRRAGRIDANQNLIVAGLRDCGYSVAITSQLGSGFPDIIVGSSSGRNYLFEIKDPSQPPSKRKLTKDEEEFKASWRGQYAVIETLDDALKILDKK